MTAEQKAAGRAAQNRSKFPNTARIVDQARAVFGADVKLVWAAENGREIGTRASDGEAVRLENMVTTAPQPAARNTKGEK